jgi:hypothetical protein
LKGVQGGFFFGKKPLEYVLSVYTNSEIAIGKTAWSLVGKLA